MQEETVHFCLTYTQAELTSQLDPKDTFFAAHPEHSLSITGYTVYIVSGQSITGIAGPDTVRPDPHQAGSGCSCPEVAISPPV